MRDIGKLRRIDPRTVWPREAQDFTPWLAEHIELLGEALGLELELVDQETPVGDFAADILAKDLGTGRLAVIENQLEATDHRHLGQLITYASGLEAGVVIWVFRELREDHRQALDWLNRGHGARTDFFGVVVELLQIDDSKPAVHFRPVAFPNDWSRRSATAARVGSLTSKRQRYLQFFQELIDELREMHRFTSVRKGQPKSWYRFSSGVPGFTYAVCFGGGRLRAELYIDTGKADENEPAFKRLLNAREAIEKDVGERLEWEALEGKQACRVAAYRDGSIDDPDENLEQYRTWAVEKMLVFRKVFGPRLQRV